MKKTYRIFESLRVTLLVTFISGFINAYTYNTQGGRFAGAQTGNVIMMMISLAKGSFKEVGNYLLPLLVFMMGQFAAYFARQWASKKGLRWHALGTKILLVLLLITAIISPAPAIGSNTTITLLAFFSSLLLDNFRRVRGLAYANVMMTGNVKTGSHFLVAGLVEKNPAFLEQAYLAFSAILGFMLGVLVSSLLTVYFFEYALFIAVIPLLVLNYLLITEKPA